MTIRTYHDPLHHGITLDDSDPAEKMVMNLIDSKPFQRLRRIKQLGPAYLTFHGAESSRFTHSIGVFHIARKAFKRLVELDKQLEKHKGLLYGSALLHDLGHGPMSHTGEEIFGIKHESWSAKLIRETDEIKTPLEHFASETSIQVANLLSENTSTNCPIKALVSSQLDCDRLDYLLRDSYSTGTSYGSLDLDRIISALTLAPDGGLAIQPKGLMAVEHYLVVRNLMYRSVYNHRINEVCSWLLEQIFLLAKRLGPKKVWTDSKMYVWLWEPNSIDIDTFLANDDVRTFYHLLRWSEEGEEPISELCKCFLNRHLLKAFSIDNLSNEGQLEALTISRKFTEKIGKNPDLYCGIRHQRVHGYHPYKGGLRLWDGKELKALEKVSPLVQGLTNPAKVAWLIHPKEIHKELINAIQIHQNN